MGRVAALMLASGVLQAIAAAPTRAQTAENVAVVINDESPASQQIGEYYVRMRGLPASNVIHIRAPTTDEVSQLAFAVTIEAPIAAAIARGDLEDRILYLVLTKGVPLRISGTKGPKGTVASVDSELTLLYRRLTGAVTSVAGPTANPYYLSTDPIDAAKPFTHAQYDIYLVTRLDAFTVNEALRLVDKGLAPVAHGRVVLDEKATLFDRTGEDWLEEAAKRLADLGHGDEVALDREAAPARNVDDVLGYYSWGSNDPANRVRDFGMHFVPGALAGLFVSSDSRTFKEPPEQWKPTNEVSDKSTWFEGSAQSLSGDLIREGATGVAGYVAEPLIGATVRPQILFPAYFGGRTLAESFYLATPYISWQTVVIGDPLCRPFPSKPVASSDLQSPTNPGTGLPKFFSERTVAVMRLLYGLQNDMQAEVAARAQRALARGDADAAKVAFAELVKSAPHSALAQLRFADLLNNGGEYDAAIEHYRAVLRVQPNNAVALNNLAYVLAVQKHAIAEAKELSDQAIKLLPRDASVNDTAGWVAYLSGDYERASRLLAQAVAGQPNNAEIRLHAAFAYEAAGARAAALSELNTATKLAPKLEQRIDVKELRKKLGVRGPVSSRVAK